MQSDLQSVGNGAIGTFARDFSPKMCETALDRSWRKVQVIMRRETAVSHIFGAKARANVLIAPFPTDGKSDCIRSALNIQNKHKKQI